MVDKHSINRRLLTHKKQSKKVDGCKTFGRKYTVFDYQHTRLQNKSTIPANWIHNLISGKCLLHLHSRFAIDYFFQ